MQKENIHFRNEALMHGGAAVCVWHSRDKIEVGLFALFRLLLYLPQGLYL